MLAKHCAGPVREQSSLLRKPNSTQSATLERKRAPQGALFQSSRYQRFLSRRFLSAFLWCDMRRRFLFT